MPPPFLRSDEKYVYKERSRKGRILTIPSPSNISNTPEKIEYKLTKT